jgi:hypothetical protein
MQSGFHSDDNTIGKRAQSVQMGKAVRPGHVVRVTTRGGNAAIE